MASIATISSAAQALPQVNIHPHGHGHRHGGHVKSTDSPDDSSTDTAAQVPASTQQSLFGTLLSSLEQVIGLQPATPASAAGAPTATTAASGVSGSSGTTTAPNNAAATNANNTATLLKNYLNNLSQNVNGSSAAQAAGVHVNA